MAATACESPCDRHRHGAGAGSGRFSKRDVQHGILEEWSTTKDPKSLLTILAEHGHDIRELAVDIIRRNGGPPTYTEQDRMFDELYSHGHPYSGTDCYNHDHWDHGLLQPDCPDPLTSFGLLSHGMKYLGEYAVRLDCDHIREVANPFAPALNFDWLTDTVKLLVNGMLRQGDFSRHADPGRCAPRRRV